MDGIHARAAESVDRCPGNSMWKTRKKKCHTTDVPIILSGLIRTSPHHILNAVGVETGSVEESFDDNGTQVVGSNFTQYASVFSDWSSYSIDDNRLCARHKRLGLIAVLCGVCNLLDKRKKSDAVFR